MGKWMMPYLRLSNILLLLAGCSNLKPVVITGEQAGCLSAVNQRVLSVTYNTQLDFLGKHLSGLLLFKTLPDSAKRAIFMTETGFKFFDFEFKPDGFSVKYCLPGLNKKIIINTFRNDLGPLLYPYYVKPGTTFRQKEKIVSRYRNDRGGYNYYFADEKCENLYKMEVGGSMGKYLSITTNGLRNNSFDTINIEDGRAHLHIFMKQIDK